MPFWKKMFNDAQEWGRVIRPSPRPVPIAYMSQAGTVTGK